MWPEFVKSFERIMKGLSQNVTKSNIIHFERNVFERKVTSALESYTEMNETEEKYEKIVKNEKVDLS